MHIIMVLKLKAMNGEHVVVMKAKEHTLGDPVEVTIRGYELSVRKDDAENIEVE